MVKGAGLSDKRVGSMGLVPKEPAKGAAKK
jgi:hypothetical protein